MELIFDGKEIKTKKDILWLADELAKRYKSGKVGYEEMMGLAYLEQVRDNFTDEQKQMIKNHKEKNKIKSRFEILDL